MPKFEVVAEHLRTLVQSGQLRPGDQLPSIAQLKQQFNVSQGTVRSAMLVLKTESLVGRV
jgi:DNA-binding GntR family transcriptional regulator